MDPIDILSQPPSAIAPSPGLLVPVDFSSASALASRKAVSLAQKWGARVTFVHVLAPVVELTNVQPPMGKPGPRQYARFHQEIDALRTQADVEITALRDSSLDFSLPRDVQVVEGTPHRAICRLAQRLKAALVVMGSHGRTGWHRALIGSNAERVVRDAPCSVLVSRGNNMPPNQGSRMSHPLPAFLSVFES
jgi:nucleotide-binding universal stress UspA family protein